MPKAFISYNWTSVDHQSTIVEYAKRLIGDGVEIVMDVFDLREGGDKFKFMESMVNDPGVTHVLMFCDGEYARKANGREAGVGTESQIISKEIYSNVRQEKFIGIVCKRGDDGQALVPTFYASRIHIDFSSPEKANENWEQLLRVLHNRPLHTRPPLGRIPAYIVDAAAPYNPAAAKWNIFRQALLSSNRTTALHRADFVEACLQYVDQLRPSQMPTGEGAPAQFIIATYVNLKPIRNLIIDWVLVESMLPTSDFRASLISFFERLLSLREKPDGVNQWSEWWFEGHRVFAYEVLLYVVAALLKSNDIATMRDLFEAYFLTPEGGLYRGSLKKFDAFCVNSDLLGDELSPAGQRLYSPVAELLKRHANRDDIKFGALIEADMVLLLVSLVSSNTRWFPQTIYYLNRGRLAFFERAKMQAGFAKLSAIIGISDAEELKTLVKNSLESRNLEHAEGLWHLGGSLQELLQVNNWTSLK